MKKRIFVLYFISILLSQANIFAAGIDISFRMTLVPPSPVSDKINFFDGANFIGPIEDQVLFLRLNLKKGVNKIFIQLEKI